MNQTNEFLNSKLNDHWQKEQICQYIAQNLYLNRNSMKFDQMLEIKIFRWLIESPFLMENYFMYDILLKCFYNVNNKLNLEEVEFVVGLMIQKLLHQEYIQSTINVLIGLTNKYELVQLQTNQSYHSMRAISEAIICINPDILSNIVCENYFDHLDVEQLIAYFVNYIDNHFAIEALTTISDDKRFIMYLNKYFYLFQEDDDRMVIVINFFSHYMTSIDQLMHNLLEILKQTTNRNAQLKICELIRKHQLGNQFDPIIQHLLWQNKIYLEQLAEDENLLGEVRNLLNQIFDYLEMMKA
ncbi:hypothetical protein pb186bvf_013892 [Paramecium bursaria]